MSRHENIRHSEFLKSSATLLGSQSPSTSAHLFSLHTHILHENFKPLKFRDYDKFCGACGSLRQPEFTRIKKIPPKSSINKIQKIARGRNATSQGGAVIYTCLRCYRRTVKPEHQSVKTIEAPQQNDIVLTRETKTKLDHPLTIPNSVGSKPATIDNANSKKRAKVRKQGALQTLLIAKQRSQSIQDTSSPLDLLDFLQQ